MATLESKPNAPMTPLKQRFIACMQSTGRVGKSTFAEGLISWLKYAKIPFCAMDGDRQHRTLSRRHPDYVDEFDAAGSFDDFSDLIKALPDNPVVIVDFPANHTDFLLESSEHFQLLKFFEKISMRPTLLIFAADDLTAKESAANTVRFFGDGADYLLIENPARYKSSSFNKTPFAHSLKEKRGTPVFKIPTITSGTMDSWEAIERKHKTYFSLDAIRDHPDMHEFSRMELDYVRNQFLVQCEDCASRILPDTKLLNKENKVFRAERMKSVAVNALEDQDFA